MKANERIEALRETLDRGHIPEIGRIRTLLAERDAAMEWLRNPEKYREEIYIALQRCGACRHFTLAYHDMAIGGCGKIPGRDGSKLMTDECSIGEFTPKGEKRKEALRG